MKPSHIIYIAAALAASGASAQDLSTEITVDRTVVPRERPATRPANFLPEPYTPATTRPALFPSEYFNPSALTPDISTLRPANWHLAAEPSPYRGYASIGYFPALNLGANAGYRFIQSERSSLGAWLQYNGAQYKASDCYGTKDTYKSHDFTIGINGRHCFKRRSVLTAAVDFSLGAKSRPWDTDGTFSRSASTFRFDAGFESSTARTAYAIGASVAHFGFNKTAPVSDYPKLRQTDIGLRGSIGLTREDGNSRWLGLDIESQILFTNISPNSPTPRLPNSSATLSATALRPFVSFDNGKGQLRLGLDLSAATGEGDATYRIAPDVFAAWTPSPQFMAYAKATGGQHLNPARQINSLLPWLLSQGVAPRTDIPYQARVGLQYGPWKGFNAEIFGQYAKAESAIMPLIILDPKYVKSTLGYYNIKGWQLGAELQYKFSQPYTLRLAGTFSPSRNWYADLDRARFTLDAEATASPIPALDITLSYNLRAGRRVNTFKPEANPVVPEPTPGDFTGPSTRPYSSSLIPNTSTQLHNISSLNIGAAYRITPRLTAFARGENILGHKALDPAGVGLQGIRGLAGVAYKF